MGFIHAYMGIEGGGVEVVLAVVQTKRTICIGTSLVRSVCVGTSTVQTIMRGTDP